MDALTLDQIRVFLSVVDEGSFPKAAKSLRRLHVDLPLGANKPIEDIEASLLAATRWALDELVWCARSTMGAKAAVTS
jgi:hypothetical protein